MDFALLVLDVCLAGNFELEVSVGVSVVFFLLLLDCVEVMRCVAVELYA